MKKVKPLRLFAFTLTGEKDNKDNWKNPTISYGISKDAKPTLYAAINRSEPVTTEEWRANNIGGEFDVNGFHIFVEKARKIIASTDDVSFETHLLTNKFTESGVYVPGELVLGAIVTYGRNSKGIYIRIENPHGVSVECKFRTPYRNKFYQDGKPMDEVVIAEESATAHLDAMVNNINQYQLLNAIEWRKNART